MKTPVSSYQDKVHCLSKNDSTTYYIINCSGKASSRDGYEWLEAYEIVGDTVERVNVVNGAALVKRMTGFRSITTYLHGISLPWKLVTTGL